MSPAATDDTGPAVRVTRLARHFGRLRAVDGLTFSVARGSLTALLGPNGAGKTTTVDICEGFSRPDAGSVSVLGMDPWRERDRLRPRLGVMLQGGGAHGAARTREMLSLVAACAAHPHDVDALLGLVGLTAHARTPVRRLSGGQAQRLGLAMALVGRPELLFLDEPTAGMDPQARHLVWDILRAARADGVTILLTTHLLDEVELLADHVVIVDRGRTIAEGTPGELVGPHQRLTFVTAAGLDLAPLHAELGAGIGAVEACPGQYVIDGDLPATAAAAVTRFCAAAGVTVSDLTIRRRTLDEVFLGLIGDDA